MILKYCNMVVMPMAVAVSFLVTLCSFTVYAGDIKPIKNRRSLRDKKTKNACKNDVKSIKTKKRKWPGQGDPEVERARKCVRYRESRGNYTVADKTGSWFGAYQFAVVTSNTAAKLMNRPDLVGITANKWTRAEQDAAFYLIYDEGHGKKHFYHPTKKCF